MTALSGYMSAAASRTLPAESVDGTVLAECVRAVRGTVPNPMSKAEVGDKAGDLMAPVLGAEKTTRMIEAVSGLEAITDIRALRPLLQRVA